MKYTSHKRYQLSKLINENLISISEFQCEFHQIYQDTTHRILDFEFFAGQLQFVYLFHGNSQSFPNGLINLSDFNFAIGTFTTMYIIQFKRRALITNIVRSLENCQKEKRFKKIACIQFHHLHLQ